MIDSLSRRIARHPRRTILTWLVVAIVGYLVAMVGVTGTSLFERLTTGDASVEGSESERGGTILSEQTVAGATVTLLASNIDPKANGLPAVMNEINDTVASIPGVRYVTDPFLLPEDVDNPAAEPLLAQGGDGFLLVAEVDPDLEEDEEAEALAAVAAELGSAQSALATVDDDVTTLVGGNALIEDAIHDQVQQDLITGEAFALPLALIIMVLVFGGFLAASLPMAAAIASIGAGLGTLYLMSYPLAIDGSIVNVVTLLAIGLSIDYGLLIVSRFREELSAAEARELAAPATAEELVRRRSRRRTIDPVVLEALSGAMRTAGRTVVFSAVTVAISIAGLMVFEPDILRAIGAAGLAIVLLAVGTGVTLVPALLVLTGRHLGKEGVLHKLKFMHVVLDRTADVQSDEGFFSKLATRVQRHPIWFLVGTIVVLVILALPITGLQMRNSEIALLPESDPQRQFVTELTSEYPASTSPDLLVVTEAPAQRTTSFVNDIEDANKVDTAAEAVQLGEFSVIGVEVVGNDPGGSDATSVVEAIRSLDPGFEFWVTGQAAGQVDFVAALSERLGWAVAIVMIATLILLFLMTGSVVMPVKALLTNALSLAASLGVLVWVFQDGHLDWLLDFQSTGGLETFVVALVIAFAFGLAMDYEVFLLARIKEIHDTGVNNNESVRLGLQRSGRIITSAAAIIVVVFAGFIFGELLVIKEVGFALAFAVALDATIVRMLLVPATMTVLGEYNWWAPGPLRKLHQRFSITQGPSSQDAQDAQAPLSAEETAEDAGEATDGAEDADGTEDVDEPAPAES